MKRSIVIACVFLALGPLSVAQDAVEGVDARADLSAANALVREGDFAGAEALLAELQIEYPEDPALLLQRGELLLALARPADAIDVLSRSAELDGTNARTHFQLGSALASTDQRSPAIDAFARAIELAEEPDLELLAGLNRSLLLQQERRWGDAAAALEQVLAIDAEGHLQAFGDLATLYIQDGQLNKAQEALARGAESGFRSAQHYYSLGARMFKAERYEDAEAALRACLKIDDSMARAERSLIAVLDKLGRNDEAREHIRRYLELRPDAKDAAELNARLEAGGG